jgi:hypothetical protein
MTISYTNENYRAFDGETGIAITYLGIAKQRDTPDQYFLFEYQGKSHKFTVSFGDGYWRMRNAFPTISIDELWERINEMSERDYKMNLDFIDWKSMAEEQQAKFLDSFIAVFKFGCSKRIERKKFNVTAYADALPKSLWRKEP